MVRTLVVRATILQRVLVLDVARDPLTGRPSWPDGARFAFTVFDDTDFATPTRPSAVAPRTASPAPPLGRALLEHARTAALRAPHHRP